MVDLAPSRYGFASILAEAGGTLRSKESEESVVTTVPSVVHGITNPHFRLASCRSFSSRGFLVFLALHDHTIKCGVPRCSVVTNTVGLL